MKNLERSCMSRQESWWTYEVCFRPTPNDQEQKHIITDNNDEDGMEPLPPPPATQFTSGARQFRVNTILLQEGKAVKYAQV